MKNKKAFIITGISAIVAITIIVTCIITFNKDTAEADSTTSTETVYTTETVDPTTVKNSTDTTVITTTENTTRVTSEIVDPTTVTEIKITENTTETITTATENTTKATNYTSENTTEKITESTTRTEKVTETTTETVTERPTEKTTEKVTEKPEEKTTEKVTEKPTEETTETVTEKSTEKTTEKPVEPHKHSYTAKITKNATCTTDGVKTYTCSCGDSYTEIIKATGHNWGKTCQEDTNYVEKISHRVKVYIDYCGNKYYTKEEAIAAIENGVAMGYRTDYETIVDQVGSYDHVTYHKCSVCGEKEIISTEHIILD